LFSPRERIFPDIQSPFFPEGRPPSRGKSPFFPFEVFPVATLGPFPPTTFSLRKMLCCRARLFISFPQPKASFLLYTPQPLSTPSMLGSPKRLVIAPAEDLFSGARISLFFFVNNPGSLVLLSSYRRGNIFSNLNIPRRNSVLPPERVPPGGPSPFSCVGRALFFFPID